MAHLLSLPQRAHFDNRPNAMEMFDRNFTFCPPTVAKIGHTVNSGYNGTRYNGTLAITYKFPSHTLFTIQITDNSLYNVTYKILPHFLLKGRMPWRRHVTARCMQICQSNRMRHRGILRQRRYSSCQKSCLGTF